MKINAAYFLLLLLFAQALEHWGNLPGSNFVAMYNPIIWAIICGAAGALYPIVQTRSSWLTHILQLATILISVHCATTALYLWLHPSENRGIALRAGFYFLFIPSVVATLVFYSIGRLVVPKVTRDTAVRQIR